MFTSLFSSLRSRLVALIIIAVIPALGYILVTASEQRNQREAEIRAGTMHMAKLAANNLERLGEGSHQLLSVLAQLPAVQNFDERACNAQLATFNKQLPMYANIAAVRPSGEIFCSAFPIHDRKINLSDRLYFKNAVKTKSFSFGEFTMGRVTHIPTMSAALPVMNSRQQFDGIVYAAVDLNWFKEQLSEIKIPEHAVLGVLDRNMTVLYRHPNNEKWVGRNLSGSELNREIGDREEGIAETRGSDGIERIWAFTQVSGTDKGMSVRYGLSRAAAFADINQLLKKNLIVLLIITCMALAVAWYGGNYFVVRRMRMLAKATDELAKGNLRIRVDIKDQRDEISHLGRSFNKMAEALERHIEERKESEEQYRTLFEESKDAIYVTSPEGRFLDVNTAAVELFGYASKEEMLTLDITKDIYPAPEDRNTFTQKLREKGFVKDYEQRLKRRDGTILTVVSTTTVVRDKNGDVIAHRGIKHDITKRKQAEEALRERNTFINTILEASPVAIYSMDREGIILTWNKGAELMFGWSKEDVIGNMHPIVPEEERESFLTHRQTIRRGERLLGVELRRSKKDGSPIDISLSAAPLFDESGAVAGQISVVMDITQQKKMEAEHTTLENQLRQAQKMEAVGQLGGGIAHDFNNILSAIVGYSHLSLMKMSPGDPNRHNIEQVLASSERGAALTQRLLAFSRKQVVNLARVDLNDIIAKFKKFLIPLLREDIEFKTTHTNFALPIMADRGQLEQVLMNLVTNSRDAMPQGGHISIETGLVQVDRLFIERHGFGLEGGYALLSVVDTGIGIPKNIQSKVFDPFFTTKEEGKGTGLGLSMVYGIVKKHEGHITVYSQPGIGTTFKVYIPVAQVAEAAEEQKADEQNPVERGTETVLIAEDDATLRALTASVLRHFGYTVIEAVDGPDAVAKFMENLNSIRIVILDGIMPKMNGKAAWKEIKALSTRVKAIFISGYAEDIFTNDGIPDGEGTFIQKPYPPLVLAKRIREVLDA